MYKIVKIKETEHFSLRPQIVQSCTRYYLFENCGAFLAFFRPYFFLSFARESLVKNPFDFKAGLYSKLASFNALAIP